MDFVIGLALVAGLAGVGALVMHLERRATLAWRKAGEELGVPFTPAADGRRFLVGELDGYPLRVSEFSTVSLAGEGEDAGSGSHSPASTRFEVGPLPWLPRSAHLARNTRMGRLAASGWGERILTGDPAFDEEVLVYGPPRTMMPLLDHDARVALREGVKLGVLVEGGVIRRRSTGTETRPHRLIEASRAMTGIAAGLDPGARSLVGQLLWIARRDPVPEVRTRAARALAEWYPDDPRTGELAAELSRSGHPHRRLLALEVLGDAGIPLARELAMGSDVPDDVRRQARAYLDERGESLPAQPGGHLSVVSDGAETEGRLSAAGEGGELQFSDD